ncbi:MAG: hypothetical protein ACXW3G_08495 [Rhodoplanes sp.]
MERRAYLKYGAAANVCKAVMGEKFGKLGWIVNTKSVAMTDAVSHMTDELKFRSAIKISCRANASPMTRYAPPIQTRSSSLAIRGLVIDADYFEHVIIVAKRLSGAIQRETEKKYG